MRTFFLLLVLSFCPAAAQDPAAVNPKIVKVEFENDQVRILRMHYEPHERLEMHSHPAKAEVQLTAGSVRIFTPDGKSSDEPGSAGEFFWLEPTKHAVENLENTPLELIEIEMKKVVAPSVPASAEQAAKPPLKGPVPVEDEPHHHWKFENQYVRVLEEVLAPGESTLVHTHSHDGIGVYLSSASLQEQEIGKQWGPPSKVRQGQVNPPEGGSAKLPLTHRVKNAGTTVLHLIFIELLR